MKRIPRTLGRAIRRQLSVVGLCGAMLAGLASCGYAEQREAELLAHRESQLREYELRVVALGHEITEWIPEEEVALWHEEKVYDLQLHMTYPEWPKAMYWVQELDVVPDGPRTSTELVDALESHVTELGWERRTGHEFPPGRTQFTRHYVRPGYFLQITVRTFPVPEPQGVMFRIGSPHTD